MFSAHFTLELDPSFELGPACFHTRTRASQPKEEFTLSLVYLTRGEIYNCHNLLGIVCLKLLKLGEGSVGGSWNVDAGNNIKIF